jgi:TPR repeat protein
VTADRHWLYRTRCRCDARLLVPGIAFAALAAGLIGCQQHTIATDEAGVLQATAASGIGATTQLAVLDAADFEVVDCVLPARISRLGRNLTFLGARRPIRTTGRDCAIRGGEYVAYDRANYATALKIWQPLADQGDAEAQTYVGEIYEKGLGRSPDYAVAADWYRRAAEQGYATAEVSLGQLYEQGLGVPKDMMAALDLYRQASGLGDAFEIVSAAELQTLQGQVDQSQRKAEARSQQVASVQRELSDARTQLQKLRDDAEAERQALELARRQLAEERESLTAGPERLKAEHESRDQQAGRAYRQAFRQVELQQAAREAALAQRNQELDRRVAEISAREAEHQQKVTAERASIQAGQRELQLAQRQLAEQRSDLDTELRQLELQRERGGDEQMARARQVEAQEAELREQHATLEEREAELARRSEELARQATEISAREAERRQDVATERASIQAAQRDLQVAQSELSERRANLDTDVRALESQRKRLAEDQATQTRQVDAQQAEVREQHATLEEREAELARRSQELDRRIAEVESRASEIEDKQNQLTQPTPETQHPVRPLQKEDLISFGNYYALVIGNGSYQYSHDMPMLSSPEADAVAISALLTQKYGYTVIPLVNANRDQILGALNTLRETLKEGDNLLIYYAGHGILDENNGRGYWLPVDAEPYPQTAKWISTDDITDILNSMHARHVLVVADSCYSGSLTSNYNSPFGLGVPEEERFYWLKTIANKPARMALTSGNLSPVLDGGGGQHSIFAMALLDVLGANDHVMEGWRVYLRVSARVSDVAQIYGLKQVPTYGPIKSEKYAGGDFLFVRS